MFRSTRVLRELVGEDRRGGLGWRFGFGIRVQKWTGLLPASGVVPQGDTGGENEKPPHFIRLMPGGKASRGAAGFFSVTARPGPGRNFGSWKCSLVVRVPFFSSTTMVEGKRAKPLGRQDDHAVALGCQSRWASQLKLAK